MNRRNMQRPEEPIAPRRAIARARHLVAALLCIMPPLYLSNRLLTLHTVEDNKWLAVVFLSLCETSLIALAAAMRATEPRRPRNPLILALLTGATAFALAHIISALLSHEPGFSLRATIPPLSLIVLFGMLIWQPPKPRAIRELVVLTVAIGALAGFCALAQHWGFDPLAQWVRYREADRYRTGVFVTFGNPEYLGGYLAPLAVVSLGLTMIGASWGARSVALLAAVLTAVPAILSGSRGAFLGLALGALVLLSGVLMIVPSLSRRVRIGGFLLGGAMVALLVAVLFFGSSTGPGGLLRARLADLANPYSDSIRGRIVFNLVGAEMIAKHPVTGIGPGMFGIEFYPTFLALGRPDPGVAMDVIARDFNGAVAEHAHNDWLEIWAATGTVGFAAWLWILAVWAIAIARMFVQQSGETHDRLLALALVSGILALLVNALFNFPLHEPVRATLFWLTLAWSASLASVAETHATQRDSTGKKLVSRIRAVPYFARLK